MILALLVGCASELESGDSDLSALPPPPPGMRHKLLGDGARVLTPIALTRGEHVAAHALQIRDRRGRELARMATPGLRFTSLSDERVLAVMPESIASYDFAGALRWTAPLAAYSAAVARSADVVVVVDGADTRRVLHVAGGKVIKTAELRDPIWNVALAPHGAHTAVTTQRRLHTFEGGRLARSIALPVHAAVSLDIADDGSVVIGGQADDKRGVVLCYAPDGTLRSRALLAEARDGFSPRVSFADAAICDRSTP